MFKQERREAANSIYKDIEKIQARVNEFAKTFAPEEDYKWHLELLDQFWDLDEHLEKALVPIAVLSELGDEYWEPQEAE